MLAVPSYDSASQCKLEALATLHQVSRYFVSKTGTERESFCARFGSDYTDSVTDSTQFSNQLWYQIKQVADDAVIGYRENRRFRVLVDSDDGFGIFHPR